MRSIFYINFNVEKNKSENKMQMEIQCAKFRVCTNIHWCPK